MTTKVRFIINITRNSFPNSLKHFQGLINLVNDMDMSAFRRSIYRGLIKKGNKKGALVFAGCPFCR